MKPAVRPRPASREGPLSMNAQTNGEAASVRQHSNGNGANIQNELRARRFRDHLVIMLTDHEFHVLKTMSTKSKTHHHKIESKRKGTSAEFGGSRRCSEEVQTTDKLTLNV